MTEDLDNLTGDLDNLDTSDLPGADELAEGGEGESVDLGDDLSSLLDQNADDEPAAAEGGEGGSVGLSGDLGALLDHSAEDEPAATEGSEQGQGEGVELDDELQSMLNGSGGEGVAPASGAGMGNEENILGGGAPSALPANLAASLSVGLSDDQAVNLEFLLDIKLHVTFEVGRSKMLISDLLTLGQGSVIELHRLVGDELDLLVNGKLIAKGEVVVVNEKFGCKITDIIPPEDRVKHLGTV